MYILYGSVFLQCFVILLLIVLVNCYCSFCICDEEWSSNVSSLLALTEPQKEVLPLHTVFQSHGFMHSIKMHNVEGQATQCLVELLASIQW